MFDQDTESSNPSAEKIKPRTSAPSTIDPCYAKGLFARHRSTVFAWTGALQMTGDSREVADTVSKVKTAPRMRGWTGWTTKMGI